MSDKWDKAEAMLAEAGEAWGKHPNDRRLFSEVHIDVLASVLEERDAYKGSLKAATARVEELDKDLGAMTFSAKAFKTLAERLEIKVSERDKRVEELGALCQKLLDAGLSYQSDLAAARAEIERMREALLYSVELETKLMSAHFGDIKAWMAIEYDPNAKQDWRDCSRDYRQKIEALAPSAPREVEPLIATNPRDWISDFHFENGQYMNKCIKCGNEFMGYKRRCVCKLCYDAEIEALR